MNQSTFIIIIYLTFICSTKGYGKYTFIEDTTTTKEFLSTWEMFSKAIISNDQTKFKELSLESIYCTDCVTNTTTEDSIFKNFENNNPNTWYEKLYDEFSYILIDRF